MTHLTSLDISQTQVWDLSPLTCSGDLEKVSLDQTEVTNIKPLRDLHKLQTLHLDGSAVADLRPLLAFPGLRDLGERSRVCESVSFKGCAAARNDPEIARLAEIKDDAQRAQALLEYLQTLPPKK